MVAMHTLESVADGTLDRLSVPGGWLYRTRGSATTALAYVPDAAAAVGEPTAPPVNVDVPYASLAGSTASCTMGNWENEPTSYAYAWHRDGAVVAGAAGATYTVQAADSGHSLTCIVTASNALGSTTAPPSNAVAVA